jgi:hypothetical protein
MPAGSVETRNLSEYVVLRPVVRPLVETFYW